MKTNDTNKKFVFFGTSIEAVCVLEVLKKNNFLPELIICSPDKKVGRHQILTAPLAKNWAIENNIPTFQPEKITSDVIEKIKKYSFDLFIVAGYGKILPQTLLDEANTEGKFGTLNVHTSLLPKYRGPTPVEGPILSSDSETGITIMEIDAEVDHGPIVYQEKYSLTGNETALELTKILFSRGGEILSEILPTLTKDFPERKEQNHSEATFTHKLKKEDGEIKLTDNGREIWNKFRAYTPWPGIFWFDESGKRVKITDVSFDGENIEIKKVIPEGKKEVNYKVFLNNK